MQEMKNRLEAMVLQWLPLNEMERLLDSKQREASGL